jgi:hypothetical protein
MLHPAGPHEGQRLQRLERGAGEGEPVRIARLGQHAAARIGHGDGAEVRALARAAAEGLDQGNQGRHASILPCRPPAAAPGLGAARMSTQPWQPLIDTW